MSTTTFARAATPKQLAFIDRLRAERGLAAYDGPALSTRTASAHIDELMAMPRPRVERAPEAFTGAPVPSEPGVYDLEGVFYYAIPTRNTGKIWTYTITAEGKRGEFFGGMVKLRGARRLSAEEVSALAIARGHTYCILCSRLLTDPESVARGIGPICARNY